ncbi:MAG: radical SAM family heme chaperone HemW, partial [candidate division Zixibacteria bacterium]|nr:radical SAM family heme chaperone HemW [candidate division Zixibacteria bacterium]
MVIGIYVHIPFCLSKCSYCDFNSIVYNSELAEEYVKSLIIEIQLFSQNQTEKVVIETVYFGWGTPSILKSSQLGDILEKLFTSFGIQADSEISLEANPGTLTRIKTKELKGLGFNRLSLGAQSFIDEELKILRRVHTGKQALKSYLILREHFENLSMDLIFGIPGQTLKTWRKSLNMTIKLLPEHLSAYCLTLEEGTPFYLLWKDKKLGLPEEDSVGKMYLEAMGLLKSQGYRHYEISNFALKGFECRHNLRYWDGAEYIGFGAGAHSYQKGIRWGNIKDINKYIEYCQRSISIIDFKERLTPVQKINEFILLGLRRTGGVDLKKLKEGLDFDLEKQKEEEIRDLIKNKFL